MSERIGAGARVKTLMKLPVVNSTDHPDAPAGSEGVVRRAFRDALGGYQIDLIVNTVVIPAVVYDNQISVI